jgi:Rho-binding antiterminator
MGECSISCDLHDYLEIACMYRYQVKLTLKDGQVIEGKAMDIKTVDRREYLLIEQGQTKQVELGRLNKLLVLTPNAKFEQVFF